MPPHTMNHHENCRTARRGTPATSADQFQLPPARPRTTQQDLERLINTLNVLQISGWYHGAMTFREAKQKLKGCSNGTFLVRDSSDDRYLYALSVKTPRGTTSVRIEYEDGLFMLDTEECLRRSVPSFDCVIKLLQYYIRMSREKNCVDANGNSSTIKPKTRSGHLVWLERSGRKDTEAQIIKPLTSNVPSLQHLCRCTINRTVEPRFINDLSIPRTLKKYVQEYPYSL
ncbi:suppressor of cytokine signaling 2-like [Lytechinus variegatus]|uniref:suppressor of cytokine signaling 2-like n=1 Tax=Lytechinus variegatus TaxID=7654 RepID=UPI001BB1AA7C|nr:suppressor of cytokine signaling 2-like [Lytechinus variegatus]XP_054762937.1 suppressor of cytokine signaling 2-like [Lytechinus pictus]